MFASSRVDDVETGKASEFFPRVVSSTRLLFFQARSHLLDPLFPYHTGYPVTCCLSASPSLRCLSPESHHRCPAATTMPCSPPITFDCSHVSSVCLVLLERESVTLFLFLCLLSLLARCLINTCYNVWGNINFDEGTGRRPGFYGF